MKRFHAHITVTDMAANIDFYSKLFGQAPTVTKEDYAKWMLDDPRVNFAISTHGNTTGVNHFGLQADGESELAHLKQQAEAAAGHDMNDAAEETCCYAVSKKYWVVDPSGIPWEQYASMAESKTYYDEAAGDGCCVPSAPSQPTEATKGCCG